MILIKNVSWCFRIRVSSWLRLPFFLFLRIKVSRFMHSTCILLLNYFWFKVYIMLKENVFYYFFAVATIAAIVGQYVVRKLINIFGRVSIIIFTLSFTIFVSALTLGMLLIIHALIAISSNGLWNFYYEHLNCWMVLLFKKIGGVGIAKMIKMIEHKEYMGFDSICS